MISESGPINVMLHFSHNDANLLFSERGKELADNIGYPVMVKAALGGGGKGMRVVYTKEDFKREFDNAQREAVNGFADRKSTRLGNSITHREKL